MFAYINPVNPFIPPPYGLASAVNWQQALDDHWEGGVQWEAICAEDSTTISPCVTGTAITVPAKAATWSRFGHGAVPFTVYGELDCSPVGSLPTLEQMATQGFTNAEAWQMERVFQTGAIAGLPDFVYPNLTSLARTSTETGYTAMVLQVAPVIISGAPLDVVEGLGRLEEALTGSGVGGEVCYPGGSLLIHVSQRIADQMAAQYLMERIGGVWRTPAGHRVVIGAGYDPTIGPDGTATPAGAGWMYATGPVFGYRSPARLVGADIAQRFDRTNNTLKIIVERTVVLGYDCCPAAVLVTLGGEPAGVFNSAT